ncbi:MAG: glucose-6-phosphate dehydrogenase, partial [Thermoguttaceae bacterium]
MAKETIIHEEPTPAQKQSPFVLETQRPDPFTLIIFGATGDLTTRKLLPAFFGLWQGGFMPESFAVVGVGRRDKNDDLFREEMRTAIAKSRPDSPAASDGWNGFLNRMFYHRADFTSVEGMKGIATRLGNLEAEQNLPGNRLVYLATDPKYYGPIIEGAARGGIINEYMKSPWGRVVIEKPFGQDLKSALELDRRILSVLVPDQIYRIDHYLGKETVQNLLAFRFGNAIFEPLMDRQYVDHVQITVAETIGMEGRRGAYYDHAGAIRDVAQNHLLQLLALVAMDPPATLKARDIEDAKLKLLRNIAARKVVRGQYGSGTFQGEAVRAYRDEDAVAPDS